MKSPYKEYPLVISFNFLVPIYNNITPTRVTKTKKNGILILDQVVPSLPRAKDRYSINCYKKYNFFPILNQSSVLFGPGRGLRNIIVLFYEVRTHHLPLLVSFHQIPVKVGGAKHPRKGAILKPGKRHDKHAITLYDLCLKLHLIISLLITKVSTKYITVHSIAKQSKVC